jgi:pimeloyl-ACP methyl ester carboxylesterase
VIVGEYELPGHRCRDHVLNLPLDHADPQGEQIEVFGREVVRPDKEREALPWLLYLQGGPGHKGHRPGPDHSWLSRALEEFCVLLLDDRGTGRSTPLNRQTLPRRGNAATQAEYLAHFRADSIVADAEAFRGHLLGDDAWSILGQSYGGFCALTYLSFAPGHLREVMITGGLPSLTASADEVYRAAYPRVLSKNNQFLERYPHDGSTLRRIVNILADEKVRLPSGDRLTPERLQTIGLDLGMADRFDSLHFLLEEAFIPGGRTGELSETFLWSVEALTSFATQPLFAVMHEPIYAQGEATRWAAHRVRDEFAAFDALASEDDRVMLTGEMIYPWQFEQDSALVPLGEVADLLAQRDDWPRLYDADQLRKNTVPVSAAIYYNDMYVDREMSMQTASVVRGLRPWVTNQYEHDGLRQSGVLDRLLGMARGIE